ncbi:MAG: 1,4-dihydroxy-2-naphthoate octaprenyltransferase [Arenicella sp.]|jgi:1,4-dihydroxy-2-naphthoate octaprenyltransferase
MDKKKSKAWLGAMRLRTLPLSFSVIIAGNALAFDYLKVGHMYDREFSWVILSLTLLTTLLLQVLSNLANDYGDAKKGTDNENRVGPERAVQSGVISLNQMKKGIVICSLLAFISGILLLFYAFKGSFSLNFFLFLGLGLLCIAAAIKYTVGKKAYGYHALGDLFVFIFFGFVGVFGSFTMQASTQILADYVIWPVIILSVMMGAICTMVLNLNNMRDIVNDEAVGKNTLVVKLGPSKAKIYHFILFFLFWGPIFAYYWIAITYGNTDVITHPVTVIIALLLIFHVIHMIKVIKTTEPHKFDSELKKIAISSFIFSVVLLVTFMIQ